MGRNYRNITFFRPPLKNLKIRYIVQITQCVDTTQIKIKKLLLILTFVNSVLGDPVASTRQSGVAFCNIILDGSVSQHPPVWHLLAVIRESDIRACYPV